MKCSIVFVILGISTTFASYLSASVCLLSGTYSNTAQFQNAINSCGLNDTLLLTGSAQWSGTISIGSNQKLVISSSATINGSGSLISTNPVVINSGAVFTMSAGSTVTIGTSTFNGPVTLSGPAGITSTGGPLPVELVLFYAESIGSKIRLNWQTASEQINLGFDIERSFDGVQFDKIGFVKGKGTTSERSEYFFEDENFYSLPIYYRLKQIDEDGNYMYSKIIVTSNISFESKILVTPIPAKDILSICCNEELDFMIYNIDGRIFLRGHLSEFENTLNIRHLQNGNYFIAFVNIKNNRNIVQFSKLD